MPRTPDFIGTLRESALHEQWSPPKFPCRLLLALMACVALASPAVAGDWTIGVETLSDRAPDNFVESTATKFQLSAARTFASGVVISGSFEPQIKTDNQEVSYNLDATLGYTWKLNRFGSLGGSAGVGERFQQESSGGNFPITWCASAPTSMLASGGRGT
jgi:hypothetical protein